MTFLYKPEYDKEQPALQYGLIAEEVAEVYPDLVANAGSTVQVQPSPIQAAKGEENVTCSDADLLSERHNPSIPGSPERH